MQSFSDQANPPPGLPLIIDNFAGGGGTSTGIEMALGRSPNYAITISKPTFTLYRECGIGGNPKNVLFPTAQGRTGKLSDRPMTQADESARATGLYDRRDDEISLDEVERIGI